MGLYSTVVLHFGKNTRDWDHPIGTGVIDQAYVSDRTQVLLLVRIRSMHDHMLPLYTGLEWLSIPANRPTHVYSAQS